MLVNIESGVEAVILLHPEDNVGIARMPLAPGRSILVGPHAITVSESIPAGHKVALRPLGQGEIVRRYGQPIGQLAFPVQAGMHVHSHNLRFAPEATSFSRTEVAAIELARDRRVFQGFRRADGRAGTRNYIAIVAASNCASYTASQIERYFADVDLPPNVDGVVSFPHGDGCGQSAGPDTDQLRRTLEGVLDHPNVAAALILGLGCEVNQVEHYLGKQQNAVAKTLAGLTLQESGGTRNTIKAASVQIEQFISEAANCLRSEISASELTLGLNCGGSDSFSGITANPALGHCCDLLVRQGGTVVLAETTEIFGAEHILLRRAASEEVAQQLLNCVEGYKRYLQRFEGSFDDNPSPGNKEGGLTNIVEKSLGAVAKAGTTPLCGVVDYAERIASRGFVFMNTPGYDPVSLAGLAAGGVNLIAFTTGRGSAIGFPTIPVFKISSNTNTFSRMPDNMDLDAGTIASGQANVQEVGTEIFERLLRIASGEKTKAEILGHHEFVPWRIGPVL